MVLIAQSGNLSLIPHMSTHPFIFIFTSLCKRRVTLLLRRLIENDRSVRRNVNTELAVRVECVASVSWRQNVNNVVAVDAACNGGQNQNGEEDLLQKMKSGFSFVIFFQKEPFKYERMLVFNLDHFSAFCLIFVFWTQLTEFFFANDWIWTVSLWWRIRPLYQLSHNHCPIDTVGCFYQWRIQNSKLWLYHCYDNSSTTNRCR